MLMTHHPASFSRHIARMKLAAETPQVLSSMIEIHDPTAPLRLSVQAAGKLFGSFDRSRVAGAVFVSYWPAFGIQLGLV